MAIELANGVSYCLLDGTAIFFDLVRDRYFATSSTVLKNASSTTPLARRGLLVGSGELGQSVRPVARLKPNENIASPESGSGMFATMIALSAMLRTVVVLRRTGLATAIRRSRIRRPAYRTRNAGLSEYQRILSSFKWVDRLYDQNRACLTRSLAMRSVLSAQSLPATLVIGLKLHPFSAHAWLQKDDVVLNDTLDRVRHYQPVALF